MKIWILRHGETDWNVLWKMQGQTDIPLNEKGIAQAKEAAERLKSERVDAIYSSPLSRAYETARIIAEPHGLQIVTDDRLKEMSFGEFEGTTPEYNKINPNRERFFSAPEKYVPSGGETIDEAEARCLDFLNDLKKMDHERVLIVTHGALARAMIGAVKNVPHEHFWDTGVMSNCGTLELEI